MEKIKKHKEIFIIALVILGIAFYWFQIRPTSIKKECSWTTKTIPADPGVTKEQAEVNNEAFNSQCSKEGVKSVKCWLLEKDTKERASSQEKEETREATDKEYKQCLRQNGL